MPGLWDGSLDRRRYYQPPGESWHHREVTVEPGRATFLYDGDCAFCSSCARFIERWVPTPADVQAWQLTDLAALGLTDAECDEAVQWVSIDADGGRTSASGPGAIAALLRSSRRRGLGRLWRGLGRLLDSRLALTAARPLYRWVARNRHRMPGGSPACVVPASRRAPHPHRHVSMEHPPGHSG